MATPQAVRSSCRRRHHPVLSGTLPSICRSTIGLALVESTLDVVSYVPWQNVVCGSAHQQFSGSALQCPAREGWHYVERVVEVYQDKHSAYPKAGGCMGRKFPLAIGVHAILSNGVQPSSWTPRNLCLSFLWGTDCVVVWLQSCSEPSPFSHGCTNEQVLCSSAHACEVRFDCLPLEERSRR